MNTNCNIFIPRNIYSLFLILSKKKNTENDDYIIVNSHEAYARNFPENIIKLLKKKKFKIIFTNKSFLFKNIDNPAVSYLERFFKINFFKNLNYISNKILDEKYEEFSDINFYNYNNINLYFGSDLLYYSNLCKKYKNVNLFFLEHGAGNFFNMLQHNCVRNNNLKEILMIFFRSVFFKMRGVYLPRSTFYFGICGHVFKIKYLEYDYYKIAFIKSDLEKGFKEIFNFYQNQLKTLKYYKKNNYIFLNIPYHYTKNTYKKYLNYFCKNVRYEKNVIVLVNVHVGYDKNEYIKILIKTLISNNIKYYLLSGSSSNFPAEIILKYFNVNEIYSGYSSLLFTSFYLFREKIKINAIFSNAIMKRYKNLLELNAVSADFIKKKFVNKNVNFIDLDLIN